MSSPKAKFGRFGAYWSQQVQLWWQQFFADFTKNKCNFLRKKNELDIVRRVQCLTGLRPPRPMRSFSPGAIATTAI